MKNALNILLADDDPTIRLIVQTTLERLGHLVSSAVDGKEAIALYSAHHPDFFEVIITDHTMPFVSGLELVKYLRENHFNGRIIVMSGSLTEALTIKYRAKQVDKILQKPFDFKTVAMTFNNILDCRTEKKATGQ